MKVLFFDLETTGTLVNKHGIHQLSGMIVVDGEVKEKFDFKVQPNPKAELQNAILLSMQSNNLKKAENDYIRVSYIAPSVRKVFDNAKFQEEHADLYEKYVVNSETKPSIRISIKTENL